MRQHYKAGIESHCYKWLEGPPETSLTYKVKLEVSEARNRLASQQAQGLMPRRRGGSAGPTGTAEPAPENAGT